jgi:hypothetical protein
MCAAASAPFTPRREISAPWPAPPCLSTFSVLALGAKVPGHVLFAGRVHWPVSTAGYVRSAARARLAAGTESGAAGTASGAAGTASGAAGTASGAAGTASGAYQPERKLPWRDYDASALLAAPDALVAAPYERHGVVIGARNTLNEWGYQLRLGQDWIRRYGDRAIDPGWPVVELSGADTRLVRLSEAGAAADLVTGIPLVAAGRPSPRPFLVASCSDVAHTFDVNPRGLRGPSADAWLRLSNLWQELKDQQLADADLAARMEAEAVRLSVAPSHDLLHSVLAQRFDGVLVAFAITGALAGIASELADRWDVQHAVLLDNGGSVGWQALIPGAEAPKLLVAGPNYRPKGTAFLQFDLGEFLQPQGHPLLGR